MILYLKHIILNNENKNDYCNLMRKKMLDCLRYFGCVEGFIQGGLATKKYRPLDNGLYTKNIYDNLLNSCCVIIGSASLFT